MRVLIDALPIRTGSGAIVVEHLLEGWMQLDAGDELHVAVGPDADITAPPGVTVHDVDLGRRHYLGRMRAQATVIPRLVRDLDADILLGALPTTTINRLGRPRAVIAWDLRHELRPQEFSRQTRLLRGVSYEIGFRQAAAVVTISERTRDDLLRSRPWLRRRIVRAAQLGADHVDQWPPGVPGAPYALTFGQWQNKNVDLVIDTWAALHAAGEVLPLTVVGLASGPRRLLEARVQELGLEGVVRAEAWLSDEEYRQCFASAALIVFPSEFEGFGLPAVEAMRLGIPLIVTPEPALLETTAGHAVVMDGWDADALAAAVRAAAVLPPEALVAARERAAVFTWARTAQLTRAALDEAIQAARR